MSKFEVTVDKIIYRKEESGWTVADVKFGRSDHICAVGIMPFLSVGDRVILDGELVTHREYGQQIQVSFYETQLPTTKEEIEKYIGSGIIKGVGTVTAELIVREFGVMTLDVLENSPERLTEVPGIGPRRARSIAESYAVNNREHKTQMLLMNLGITPNMSGRIIKAYGDMTEVVLNKHPYRLADDIDGIGFRKADEIAKNVGFPENSPERLYSGLRYVLNQAMSVEGHMYLSREELATTTARTLNVPLTLAGDAISEMVMNRSLIQETIAGQVCVYLPMPYRAECEAATLLRLRAHALRDDVPEEEELAEKLREYEEENDVTLGDEQRNAVLSAVRESVCVITGGPGTGKTTSLNALIYILQEMGTVVLCAPTGRAAKRMQEATGCEACTIHRLLAYVGGADGEGGGFSKDENHPIEADTLIVDEMSMVDIFLMRSLLKALPSKARLILVGDADQLPSVGAGNVLKDIIASEEICVARLTQIYRQAQQSMIVVNAHRIHHGEYPIMRNRDTDFFVERHESAQDVIQSVLQLVGTRLPKYLGVDSLRGIQVMTPMKRGEVGVVTFNRLLQESLNPADKYKPELQRGDEIFRLGDKVMQIKNDYDMLWIREEEEGEGVFNGDIGYIIRVDTEKNNSGIIVRFEDGRCAEYDEGSLSELTLAYCMSIHKSQGSEFDAVVLPLLSGPSMLMTRNLLYTAVTRAKKLVIVVGRESCVRQMVENNRIQKRMSALSQRLRGELT